MQTHRDLHGIFLAARAGGAGLRGFGQQQLALLGPLVATLSVSWGRGGKPSTANPKPPNFLIHFFILGLIPKPFFGGTPPWGFPTGLGPLWARCRTAGGPLETGLGLRAACRALGRWLGPLWERFWTAWLSCCSCCSCCCSGAACRFLALRNITACAALRPADPWPCIILQLAQLQILGPGQYYGLRSAAACRSLAMRNLAASLSAAAAAAVAAAAAAAPQQPAHPWPCEYYCLWKSLGHTAGAAVGTLSVSWGEGHETLNSKP